MQKQGGGVLREGFVKWFSELDKTSGSVAGGKGANLAEIYNLKIPVPPGFVVTAQAYDHFLNKVGVKEEIKNILSGIDYEDTESLEEATSKIRGIIEKSEFPPEMKEEILEAYENLGADEEVKNIVGISDLLRNSSRDEFVAVRSSATTEDLAEASFAGQQDTYLNVKGGSSLIQNIKKCFASLFTPRATYYRNKKGFKHENASLAVVVQKMVDSSKSGVIFTKNPSSGKDEIIIEAVWGLGEGIVSGQITPDRYVVSEKDGELHILEKSIGKKKIAITRDSAGDKEVVKLNEEISERQVLKEHEVKRLSQLALKLEEHYGKPQDIEFAIENDELYIVQTRPITTLGSGAARESSGEIKGEVVLTGLAASPGVGSGKARIVNDLKDLKKVTQGDVLVTKMTNPDMVVTMQKCVAIVTDEGGMTAHASIVSREMGIPAVVGTQEATQKIKEGEVITVDGYSGKIYKGKVSESVQKEIKPVSVSTRTKLKVIVDLPSFAARAAKSGINSVGLARVEGIIAESGKHPKYFLGKNMSDYEKIIFKGISEISNHFEEVWVRTSDIRSDEFKELDGAPKILEANPMLGMHGIRYSLKHPEILKAELLAMKRVSDSGKKIGILIPQVISVDEVLKVKDLVKETRFLEAKIGVMVETPASVQIIKDLCEEGIDFISFGTNDLTQYTLAIDRGNREVQEIYNEMHPAVLSQIKNVIEVCKAQGVETSICGQAGSKKEMVKFLVGCGIDSISVNADVAAEIAESISEVETEGHQRFPLRYPLLQTRTVNQGSPLQNPSLEEGTVNQTPPTTLLQTRMENRGSPLQNPSLGEQTESSSPSESYNEAEVDSINEGEESISFSETSAIDSPREKDPLEAAIAEEFPSEDLSEIKGTDQGENPEELEDPSNWAGDSSSYAREGVQDDEENNPRQEDDGEVVAEFVEEIVSMEESPVVRGSQESEERDEREEVLDIF